MSGKIMFKNKEQKIQYKGSNFKIMFKNKEYNTEPGPRLIYNWNFTKEIDPLIDTIQGAEITLSSTGSSISNNRLFISSYNGYASVPYSLRPGYIYELDIDNINDRRTGSHGRFIMGSSDEGFIARNWGESNGQWAVYANSNWQMNSNKNKTVDVFNNKTLKLIYDFYGIITVYSDNEIIYQSLSGVYWSSGPYAGYFTIGSSDGQSIYDIKIKKLRIYQINYEHKYNDIAIWDFNNNTPFIDILNGEILTDNHVTVNNGIATLNASTSYLKLPNSCIFDYDNDTEFKYIIKNYHHNGGSRLFTLSNDWGSFSDSIISLCYFNNHWTFWYNDSAHNISESLNYFDDSNIEILFKKSINAVTITIFKDGNYLIDGAVQESTYKSFTSWSIGSHRNAVQCSLDEFKVQKVIEEVN